MEIQSIDAYSIKRGLTQYGCFFQQNIISPSGLNRTRNASSFFFQYQCVISQTTALLLPNGSAVQRSASVVVGLRANENFPLKLPNDFILITVHTGRKAIEKCREKKETCEGLRGFYGRLLKIMEAGGQQNNQQDIGTKLL